MNKILVISLFIFALIACNSSDRFKLSGTITNGENKILYLENTGLVKTTLIDSVKLDKNGTYSFKGIRPEYPDFYRLRIEDKFITFAVDSCEIITIEANYSNFSSNYTVEGSQTSKDIQLLRNSVTSIQRKVNSITSDMNVVNRNAMYAQIETDIENHKVIARKMILVNPRSATAYFAIYQKINNSYLFSPYVKADKPYCAAVATAYNAFMPNYDRSINVYNLVMDAIKTERKEKGKEAWNEILENSSTGYIDIELNNRANKSCKLSSFEGNVVLIDFSAYEMENSVQYIFELRELYNKYNKQGFEIYQVSLDRNKILWENTTANIPWTCVRDENGPNTSFVSSYNISSMPTTFLMNRKGEIIGRNYSFDDLDKEIKKNL